MSEKLSIEQLRAAINRLLDNDGSRGHYSALQCGEAHEEISRLLSAVQPVQAVSVPDEMTRDDVPFRWSGAAQWEAYMAGYNNRRAAMLAKEGPQFAEGDECKLPPNGWRCTRGAGHEGPCAAWPDNGDKGE